MATSAKKIIKKAFQKGGVLTKFQNPTANECNDALDMMNDMTASWSNNSMMIYARVSETFPLVGTQLNYTFGAGGQFNSVRPLKIIDVHLTDGVTDYPCEVIDDEIYAAQISMKTAPGLSYFLNYTNDYPLGICKFWPVPPSSAYSAVMLSEKQLTTFALNDTVHLPPGWERAIVFNLARELCSDYGQQCPAETLTIAVESLSLLQKAIMKNRSMDCTPQIGSRNNIYTGWNSR